MTNRKMTNRMNYQPQTPAQFIKEGLIIEVDDKFLTEDGRVIERVWAGRRGTTLKWKVEGKDYLHRNFFEAYHELHY